MVQSIVSQHQATLYVAIEGSLLVLHVHPEPDCSYIVDLQSLGSAAFEAGSTAHKAAAEAKSEQSDGRYGFSSDGQWHQDRQLPNLRAVLESKSASMPKVFFDSRRPCAFLAGRFGVKLGPVEDIQCLELEGRLAAHEEQAQGGDEAKPVEARSLRSCLE
jgi:hypothetical protein